MSSKQSLTLQALAHTGVALVLVATVIAVQCRMNADTGTLALTLYATWAFIVGLGLSHIAHEWCHYAGAVIAGSVLTVKPRVHPLFFDFSFSGNSREQFLWMSVGGLLGNVLLLSLLAIFVGPKNWVMTSLLAAVGGQFVYVLILELPVSLGVLKGKDPLESLAGHFGQGRALFLRATLAGIGTAALVFMLL